jgi:group I intron endonuclease
MLYVIYLITNLINNKKYVGQTLQGREERRWQEHSIFCINENKPLYNALKKYGAENFEFKVIETNISEELIDEREKYYIKYYNTFYLNGQGYNMTEGGQGIHGYVHTDETRSRIKESNLTTWQRIKEEEPERYARLCLNRSLAIKGKPKSAEHRAALSKIASQRTGEKNPFFGKHFSDESKEKQRENWRNKCEPIKAFSAQTGQLYKKYYTAMDAVRDLNLQSKANSRIITICKEQKGIGYGFIWRYEKDCPEDFIIVNKHEPLLKQDTGVKKSAVAKKVFQYDNQNNLIAEFDSAAEAARKLQSDQTKQRNLAKKINCTCRGQYKTCHGYVWSYKKLDD